MAIYVGENKALLLKKDKSVVEFYKGNTKIFGYNHSANGEIIAADNVHPIEHKLKVKLSSDTITDFSTVRVMRCGKNLFDADTVLPSLHNPSYPKEHWKKQADGSFYIGNSSVLVKSIWFENTTGYRGQMVISISVKIVDGKEGENPFTLVFRYTDGTSEPLRFYSEDGYITGTLISNPNKTVNYIDQSSNRARSVYIKDIMIAYGTDTEYESYNPQIAISNADGTVEGLNSLSPNMTVLSDNNNAMIHLSYC